eukprot:maker-scaffold1023_size69924-snap-gene-0.18 protein:Tk02664 transcript:maker-scaffold1023_size69924-snap-gene-0.18-mRNA-1 annotation:"unnamed protein product"
MSARIAWLDEGLKAINPDVRWTEFQSWIVIQRNTFDFFWNEEPYHALSLLVHLTSGQFHIRCFGQTLASGILDDGDELKSKCSEVFERLVPCLGIHTDDSEVANSPISGKRLVSRVCLMVTQAEGGPNRPVGYGTCPSCRQLQPDEKISTFKEVVPKKEEEGGEDDDEGSSHGRISPFDILETLLKDEPDSDDIDDAHFDCEQCSLQFQSRSELTRHRRDAHLSRDSIRTNLPCPSCPKTFKSVSSLQTHKRKFHTLGQFTCPICSHVGKSKKDLKNHMRITHKNESAQVESVKVDELVERNTICQICPKSFSGHSAMNRHMRRIHFWGVFKCQNCPETFNFASEFNEHALKHHPGDLSGACPSCKEFIAFDVDLNALTSHYKVCVVSQLKKQVLDSVNKHKAKHLSEPKPTFQCDACGKTFKQSYLLKNHRIMYHGGEMPYKCDYCEYATVYKQCLDDHLKRHLRKLGKSEDPNTTLWYYCDKCANRYVSQDSLTQHIQRIHEKIVKTFACEQCSRTFPSKKILAKHVAKEHIKREYPCQECGKVWLVKTELNNHIRVVHNPDKAKCQYCGKLMRVYSLKAHERIHTGENPYKCPICEYTCKSSATLSLHKKFIHNAGRKLTEHPIALPKDGDDSS